MKNMILSSEITHIHLRIRLLTDTPLIIMNKVISQKGVWETQTTNELLLLVTLQLIWRW